MADERPIKPKLKTGIDVIDVNIDDVLSKDRRNNGGKCNKSIDEDCLPSVSISSVQQSGSEQISKVKTEKMMMFKV